MPQQPSPQSQLTTAPLPADARRALALATWTDARFLDPLLGFVLPGAGDALGALVGLYTVVVARRHGVPRSVLARMLLNLGTDCLAGVVPVVGDLVDLVNRANLRNARLLEQHLRAPPLPDARTAAAERSRSLVFPLALVIGAVVVAVVVAALVGRQWWQQR